MGVKLRVVKQHGRLPLDFRKYINLPKDLLCCRHVFILVCYEVFALLQAIAHLGQEPVPPQLVHVLLDRVTSLTYRHALFCCHQQNTAFSLRVKPKRKIFAKNVTALHLCLKEQPSPMRYAVGDKCTGVYGLIVEILFCYPLLLLQHLERWV